MKPSESQPDFSTRGGTIDDRAADWLARHVRGLTPGEQAEFEQWCAIDQRHAACFAELERTWRSLDSLADVRLPDGRPLDHDLPNEFDSAGDFAPATARARRSRPLRPVWIVTSLAAAAAVALVFIGPNNPDVTPLKRSASTTTGGFEKLALPDGSVIRLNTDSAAQIDFSTTERQVTLARGEGNFEVAKDAARPFIVHAGHVKIRAVGTAFNIRFESDVVDVLVTEGKVRVEDARRSESLLTAAMLPGGRSEIDAGVPVLSAGHRVRIRRGVAAAPAKVVVAAVAPEVTLRELAWQERRLDFVDTPLHAVVAEFNRYNHHKLVIADSRLAERRFGGSIRADNGEAFVRLLESRFGVKADLRETQTLLRVAP